MSDPDQERIAALEQELARLRAQLAPTQPAQPAQPTQPTRAFTTTQHSVRVDLAPTPGQALGAGFGWTLGVGLAGCLLPAALIVGVGFVALLVAQPSIVLVIVGILVATLTLRALTIHMRTHPRPRPRPRQR